MFLHTKVLEFNKHSSRALGTLFLTECAIADLTSKKKKKKSSPPNGGAAPQLTSKKNKNTNSTPGEHPRLPGTCINPI